MRGHDAPSNPASAALLRGSVAIAFVLALAAGCASASSVESGKSQAARPGQRAASAPELALAQAIGELEHDGPATPEQISLYLPITDETRLSLDTTTTVLYRQVGSETWTVAHPMFRIRNGKNIRAGRIPAYATVITGLRPGTQYEVKVTLTRGVDSAVKALTHTTRALPSAAGAPMITIPAGSTSTFVQSAINSAPAGAVIQFANGTYDLGTISITAKGTVKAPIYIRGQSRAGVSLSKPGRAAAVLHLQNAQHLVIENLSIEGPRINQGRDSTKYTLGIASHDGYLSENITVRNVTMSGVDSAVVLRRVQGALVYDCTLEGNNLWQANEIDNNSTWNDDGILVAGQGNVVFNNTLSGFGDSFSAAFNKRANAHGVHFYRNRVLWGGDDGAELDYADRNITFYDNRLANTMTMFSVDPIYSGPCFVFRNVWINVGRQSFKLNNWNLGVLIYSNTVVRKNGADSHVNDADATEVPLLTYGPDGPQSDWALRNNLLIWNDTMRSAYTVRMSAGGSERTDITNNGWFPDGRFTWFPYQATQFAFGGASLADTQTKTDPYGPLFSDAVRRHEHDLIVESNPFATPVILPVIYSSALADGTQSVALSPTSVARNAGVHIPGITDGFSGAAPDVGAIIEGRTSPVVGDRS